MADLLIPFVIVVLLVVIVVQAVERYFFAEQMHKENSKLIAAVMSKNVTDYSIAIKADKDMPSAPPPNADEVSLSEATDEQFDNFIKTQTQ